MGQRLVIQIEDEGRPLANAYYHWSAYTSSSIELATDILSSLENATEYYTPTQKAVEALFASGARFSPDEIVTIEREDIDMAPYQFAFDECEVNRNDGLLCISESGMESSRNWEEGYIGIDISTKEITFDVWGIYTPAEFAEYYEDIDIETLPELNLSYPLNFDTWFRFVHDVMGILNADKYCAISPDHSMIYGFIA